MVAPITPSDMIGVSSDLSTFEQGAATDVGTLSGTVQVPVSKGAGLFQTTLTNVANWIISTYAGFTQSAAGAVARSLASKQADTISVLDFGAKGDGVTDDSVAIQAALTYLQTRGGGTLLVPARRYIVMTPLLGYTKTRVVAEPGAIFDFSQRTTYLSTDAQGALFLFRGTAAAQVLLTADAALGATTITLASVTGLAVGNQIELSHSVANTGNFSESSVGSYAGQLNTIVAITGNVVTLDTTVFEALTVANGARVRLITPVENVLIDGLAMLGKGRPQTADGDIGLRIWFGRHVTVQNCYFNKVDQRGVEFLGCLYFSAINNRFLHDQNTAGASTSYVNYAITYTSSQAGIISRNYIANPRHGVVSSNLSSAVSPPVYGISRFITVRDNYIIGTWHAGVATHNDAEHLLVVDNKIENCVYGINFRDRNMHAINNRISNCSAAMYLSVAPQMQVWRGNTVIDCGQTLVCGSFVSTSYAYNDILVENNVVLATSAATGTYGILFTGSGSTTTCRNIVVRNNQMQNLIGAGGNDAAIRFSGYFSGEICDNVVHNCSSMAGIRIDTAPVSVGVRRNRVTNITGQAFSFVAAGTDTFATDNYIKGYTTGYSGVTNVTNRNNDDGGTAFI